MAKQTINIGTTPNDGTGDTLRAAFDITNDNFTELYDLLSGGAALTASRALESDGSGYVVASSVTSTELGYVSGVTSAIQTQIDGKAELTANTFTGIQTFSPVGDAWAHDSDIVAKFQDSAGGHSGIALYGASSQVTYITQKDNNLRIIYTTDGGASGTIYGAARGDKSSWAFGPSVTASGSTTLTVKGQGSTSATNALLVENSSGTDALTVLDDASVKAHEGMEINGSLGSGAGGFLRTLTLVDQYPSLQLYDNVGGNGGVQMSFQDTTFYWYGLTALNSGTPYMSFKSNTGHWSFGNGAGATAEFTIRGSGTTNSSSGLIVETSAQTNLEVQDGGQVIMANLPTSDPGGVGLLWNDSGTLKIT